jgi:hypothetical protein
VAFGSAVSGYTSIAQALQAGDQFYYCIQGVDKPQEREVGRGTLQSDGRISRESVSGELTNFSSGTKTIALVAAAEWFAKLESGGGNAKAPFVTPQQFGAKGDGTSNDGPAFVAAIDYLKTNAANDQGIYKGSARLFVPAGHYFMGTTTLEITHTLIIEGEGSGQAGGVASKLRWAADATGIRVQRANTSSAASVDTAMHYGGDATIVQNLMLMGAFTTLASEGPYHGVHAKARVLVRDCFIQNWQGNGINIVATAGGGEGLEGNANQFAVERTTVWYSQNGCFIDGADANAGYTTGCDFSYCRQWGLWDSSFLGNNHSNHHSANCGFADNGFAGPPYAPPSIVAHNSRHYYVKAGQEAWCSANPPTGTAASNQGWIYLSDGGPLGASIPAYAAGAAYRSGGPYRVGEPDPAGDGNQSVVLTGCYAEGGSGPPQFGGSGTLVVGGIWGTSLGGWPGYIGGNSIGVSVGKNLSVGNSLNANGGQHYFGRTSAASQDLTLHLQNTGGIGTFLNFETWDGAGAQLTDDGYIFGEPGIGLVLNGRSSGSAIRFRANGAAIGTIKSAGLDLASGKALLVNGMQVVGAQQAAIADDASGAANQAKVNAMLAVLRAHGLIAT